MNLLATAEERGNTPFNKFPRVRVIRFDCSVAMSPSSAARSVDETEQVRPSCRKNEWNAAKQHCPLFYTILFHLVLTDGEEVECVFLDVQLAVNLFVLPLTFRTEFHIFFCLPALGLLLPQGTNERISP